MERMTASIRRWSGLLLCSAALVLSGCQQKSEQKSAGKRPPAAVEVATLKTAPVDITETYSGRVTAHRSAEIRPQVSGIIIKRAFEEGASVKAGDLLYQIDPAVYKAALDSAKSQLAVAQANAESAHLLATRYAKLVKTSAVSRQEADDAEASWKQAQAQMQAARAAIQSARINLEYTHIRAPISGVISRSSVTEGALVSAQQSTALATINQLSPIYVDIRQPAATAVSLKREMRTQAPQVSITLEDGTPYTETGTLKFAESQVDESTGTVAVRALFDNKDKLLLPGMYVRASVVIKHLNDALLAPQPGILLQPNGNALAMVVNKDNVIEARPVKIGRAIGDKWLIQSGLAAGDRIVIKGLQKIRPGSQVTVQQANNGANGKAQ